MLAAVIEGTTLISRPPVSNLEWFSGCFFSMAYGPGAHVQTLPDPSSYLVIEISDNKAPRSFLAGPRLRAVRSAAVEAMQVAGIRLRPGVAYLLTGVCADKCVGRRESLDCLLGPCARKLAKQIAETELTDKRFDLLESFLVERLAGKAVDRRVSLALHLIQRSTGSIRISDIAARCG